MVCSLAAVVTRQYIESHARIFMKLATRAYQVGPSTQFEVLIQNLTCTFPGPICGCNRKTAHKKVPFMTSSMTHDLDACMHKKAEVYRVCKMCYCIGRLFKDRRLSRVLRAPLQLMPLNVVGNDLLPFADPSIAVDGMRGYSSISNCGSIYVASGTSCTFTFINTYRLIADKVMLF